MWIALLAPAALTACSTPPDATEPVAVGATLAPAAAAGEDPLAHALSTSDSAVARLVPTLPASRALPRLRVVAAEGPVPQRPRALLALARMPASPGRDRSLLAVHAAAPSDVSPRALGAAAGADVVPPLVAALPHSAACLGFARRAAARSRLPLFAWQALVAAAAADDAPPACVYAAVATPVPLDAPAGGLSGLTRWAAASPDQPPLPQTLALLRGSPAAHTLLTFATLTPLASHPDPRVHRPAQASLAALDTVDADRTLLGLLAPETSPEARRSAYRTLRSRAHLGRVYEPLRRLSPAPADRCLHAELLDTARAWPHLVTTACRGVAAGLSEVRVLLAGSGSLPLREARLRSLLEREDLADVHVAVREALEALSGADRGTCSAGTAADAASALAAALVANHFPDTWRCAHRLAAIDPAHPGLVPLARHPVAMLRSLTRAAPESPAWPAAPTPAPTTLVLQTTAGTLELELHHSDAPRAVAQLAANADASVGRAFPTPRGWVFGAEEPAVPALLDECDGRPIERGAVVLLNRGAPHTGAFAFLIATQALPEWRDNHTVVGHVSAGSDALAAWSVDDRVLRVSRETSE